MGVRLKFCEVGALQNRPQGGHPNLHRLKMHNRITFNPAGQAILPTGGENIDAQYPGAAPQVHFFFKRVVRESRGKPSFVRYTVQWSGIRGLLRLSGAMFLSASELSRTAIGCESAVGSRLVDKIAALFRQRILLPNSCAFPNSCRRHPLRQGVTPGFTWRPLSEKCGLSR